MKYAKRFKTTFVSLLLVSFGLSVANAALSDGGLEKPSGFNAPRHSAGIAPDPAKLADVAIVQPDYALPDGLWYGSRPKRLVDHRGGRSEAMNDGRRS